MANGGSERKRRWKENKRSQGWAWSDIQGPRRSARSVRSISSYPPSPFQFGKGQSALSVASSLVADDPASPSQIVLRRLHQKRRCCNAFHKNMYDLCSIHNWPEYVVIDSETPWKIVGIRRNTALELLEQTKWDFTCFNPEFWDRRAECLTAQRPSIRMLRGGEPYVMNSTWSTCELRTPALDPYDNWPVAFIGGAMDSLEKLVQLGLLCLGLIIPEGKVLLIQLDTTKSPDTIVPSLNLPECTNNTIPARQESATDNAVPTMPPPGFTDCSQKPAFSAAVEAIRHEPFYKKMTLTKFYSRLQRNIAKTDASPSLDYASIVSTVYRVRRKGRIQIVLQVLVDPSNIVKQTNPFHANIWPASLPFDMDVPIEESTWRLRDPGAFVPVAICIRRFAEDIMDVWDRRKNHIMKIIEIRSASPSYLWAAATKRQSALNRWVPLPKAAQDIINDSWRAGLAVSQPFILNVTLSRIGGKSGDGITNGRLDNLWDILFSMPALRNCSKRELWTPVLAVSL